MLKCAFCECEVVGKPFSGLPAIFCHTCVELRKDLLRVEPKKRTVLLNDCVDATRLRELRAVLSEQTKDDTTGVSWLIYFNSERTLVVVELFWEEDFHCFALTIDELKKFLGKRPPWRKYFGHYHLSPDDEKVFYSSVVEVLAQYDSTLVPFANLTTPCPICSETNEESFTFVVKGPHYARGMEPPPFTDEHGVKHWHLVGFTTVYYECSKNHSWSITHYTECPAPGCDYGKQVRVHIPT